MGARRRARIPDRLGRQRQRHVEYIPLWGHDRAGEKAAFEQLIDMVVARLDAHPEMHLYHYGGYESAPSSA